MQISPKQNIFFYSKDEKILSKDYKHWIQKWCEWFYSKKNDEHELEVELVDGVYFLGTKRLRPHEYKLYNVTHNNIKNDKPILINCDKWIAIGIPFLTKKETLFQQTKERIDGIEFLNVSINNEIPIQPIRVVSDCFKVKLNRNIQGNQDPLYGEMQEIKKGKYNCVIDGFWLFIKPGYDLDNFNISSCVSCKTGVLKMNVNHDIKIN